MKTLQTVLRIVGVGGGILWFFLSLLILLFRGFKPGGPVGGMSEFQWILCLSTVFVGFVYYAFAGSCRWTRKTLLVGFIVHVGLFAAIVSIISFSDGGIVLAPLLLAGPLVWLAYALTRSEQGDNAQPFASGNHRPAPRL